jgi:multicomponent Na+:H+ antiporter subunit F
MILAWALKATFFLLSLALVFAFIRLVRGPALPDRVVALDITAIISVAIMCVYAIGYNQPVYIDIAIALALIAFLGTVAFARYALIIGKETKDNDHGMG